MAVLVNGDSYSAAEFFAAALSEYGVADVVGEKTCGKGYFRLTAFGDAERTKEAAARIKAALATL